MEPLDDDNSIHGAWDLRFEQLLKMHDQLQIKHFTVGREAISFIKELESKDSERVFLLTDFELLEQRINGLEIIEKSKVSRSILVTSHYSSKLVQDKSNQKKTKILPKILASEITIVIDDAKM